MEESSCDQYFRSKNVYPDEDIHMMVLKLLRADPDPNGANCEWIIDSFLAKHFIIDEDEETVKDDILKYKKLFGEKRPLPKKGYSEMKVMIREKMDKETKKLSSKSQTSKTSKTTFTDCKSFFKNVQKTLPEPYKSYSKERSDKLYEMIQNSNPSDDFQVCIWIVEEIKRGYIKEEELDEVKKYLIKFLKLDLPLPNFYPNFPTYSNYQLVKDTIKGDVDLLSSSDFGILLIPRNMESSCHYGAQTSWCTARRDKNNMFMRYSKKGDIFIWFDKKLKDKFQFHFEKKQFMDRDDKPISKQRFGEFVRHPILSVIFKEGLEEIKKYDYVENILKFAKDHYPEWDYIYSPEFLQRVMKEPKYAFEYARDVIKGRWSEAEPIIMKHEYYANEYAKHVIKGRWPEAEPIIMKHEYYANEYAKHVIEGRWPEAEQYIINSPRDAIDYARDVIKGRWPEAEPIIMKHEYYANEYAKHVIKGRWPEAEQYIINSPRDAIDYARDVIKGRWPEAEQYIMKNARYAIDYARDVIKGRWPEAEQYIMKDPSYGVDYAIHIKKDRWPEAEPYFLKNNVWNLEAYLETFNLKKEDLMTKQ
jgi:hypothetical protein